MLDYMYHMIIKFIYFEMAKNGIFGVKSQYLVITMDVTT